MIIDTSTSLFQDCQFFAHTAISIASENYGTAPEIKMANCFLKGGSGYWHQWILNTNIEVLLRIWNVTLEIEGTYRNSVNENLNGYKFIRSDINVLNSFFASGTS